MHEFSVLTGVVEAILKEIDRLEKEEGKVITKVNEVFLDIGELTFLGKEQLRFCYGIMSEENRLKGSVLTIETIPAEVLCHECGYSGVIKYFTEYHLDTPILSCPKCDHTVEIVNGRECSIRSVNLDIEEDVE